MTNSEELNALRDAQAYSVSTAPVSLTAALAATYHYNFTINNPISSGARLIITDMVYFGAFIPTTSTVFVGATDLAAATAVQPINLNVGSGKSDSTTIIKYAFNTTAMTGTANQPFQLPAANGDSILTKPFAIMPGQVVGFDLAKPLTLGLATASGYVMIYYFRELL